MDKKAFVSKLGFVPKDNTVGIYEKKYQQHDYSIEIDFSKRTNLLWTFNRCGLQNNPEFFTS